MPAYGPAYAGGMPDERDQIIRALVLKVAELRGQLAEAQDMLVEAAVDAGELHGRIGVLRDELETVRRDRDAWCAAAQRQAG